MSDRRIQLRLIVGATVFAALAIGAALVAGRVVIAVQLDAASAELARGDLAPYLADLAAHPDEDPDPPAAGVLVGIRSTAGAWLVDSLPEAVAEAVEHDAETTALNTDDGSWVIAHDRATTTAGPVHLWAARDRSAIDASLGSIDRLFLLGGGLLVLLFAAAAALLVRSSWRPVTAARRRERQFVSDAAHEIRTPLAALTARLAVARHALDDPLAARAEIDRAGESVSRLTDLATNLLELARLDESPSMTASSVAALRDAFLAAVDDARALPAAAGTDLDQDSPAKVPDLSADIDPVSFGRLVRNLLANAVAATPGGAVRARLRVDDRTLELAVQDDGPGMPDDFIARVGERFARPATADAGGSGLGLALVAALCRAAEGELVVRNTHPGLLATVRLPLHGEAGAPEKM
jgi:two-component system OmpR family sensor kinase